MIRYLFLLLAIATGLALAIVAGRHLNAHGMALLIGAAVGIAASVPTSILLAALIRSGHQKPATTPSEKQHAPDLF